MSDIRRALFALVACLFLVVCLTGAYSANNSTSSQAQLLPEFTPTAASAFEIPSPTTTATPQPTATLVRREVEDIGTLKIAPTTFIPGNGPRLAGELVQSGRRIDFYVGANSFSPEQVQRLSYDAEHALTYIQRRFQVSLSERVSIGFYNPARAPQRGVRGMAYTSDNYIHLFYRPGEDEYKALVIISHELAHQLEAEYYGSAVQSRADTILHEGLATWISGEYWLSLCDATSFQGRAKQLYDTGISLNVLRAEANGSDVAYEIWAGFVDYLARTYGWDAFHHLYESGRGRAPGSADYQGVYGKSLTELNQEWINTLK